MMHLSSRQMIPGSNVSRTLARTGVDWVLVDCEHGNIDGKSLLFFLVFQYKVFFWSTSNGLLFLLGNSCALSKWCSWCLCLLVYDFIYLEWEYTICFRQGSCEVISVQGSYFTVVWSSILLIWHHGRPDAAMHEAVPALAACGVSPIVRIPDNQGFMVKRKSQLDLSSPSMFP